jgi:hypothetical protein
MRQFFLASLGSFQLWIRDALSADSTISMVIDGDIATSVASSDLLALQRDRAIYWRFSAIAWSLI